MHGNSSNWFAIRSTPAACSAFAVVFTSLLLCIPLQATDANYRLCFTQAVGLPITNPGQAPTLDGVLAGDPGWTQALRYVWGNGTGSPQNAALQGIGDSTYLYLSLEVNNVTGTTINQNNLVVLAFSPGDGATPANDWRLDLYPFKPDAAASTSYTVQYRTNSAAWTLATPPASLTGNIVVANSGSSGNFSWVVEMRIPLASFSIPATGKFGFYFNVTRVGSGGFASQYFWPSFTGNGIAVAPVNTPPTSNWGDATRDPALGATCNGVSLAWSDITSDHSLYQIDALPGTTNTFTAKLNNTSVDSSGCPIAAPQITAKFSVANFGLPSNWTPVPNQNQGAQTISAGSLTSTPPPCLGPVTPGTASISSSPPWDASGTITNYSTHPDQCILVDLDSTAPNCVGSPNNCVSLLNKSVKRNMWVLTASEVTKKAEISAKGYGPPPAGRSQQEFVLRVSRHQEVLKPGEPAMSKQPGQMASVSTKGNRDRVVSRLTWAVTGCRLTGQHITINGTTYELCDDVGAFGAVVEHFGSTPVEKWLTGLEGPGLTRDPDDKDTYRLGVPQEGVVDVSVKFQPDEPAGTNKLALFLDAGAAIPHGSFGSAFNKGFSFNAGLEYTAHPHFSVEGIFGYHHFPGTITSALNLYQFSANGKAYLTNGPLRPFVNGGVGAYKFGSGSTYFGGNVGGGVLYSITSRVGLQGSYNFHAIKTPVTTEFSTVEGGIRVVF
jgi:hypothetical protein